MPVCFKKKLVFIHVPKTGGTSIIEYLNFEKNLKHFFGVTKKNIELTHYSLDQISKHLDITLFYKFSFVRNPWDRLVSKYFYYKKTNKGIKLLNNIIDFTDFIMQINNNFENIQNDIPSHYLCSHFKTQSFLVISNKCKLNFLGYYENFKQDLEKIGSKYHICKSVPFLNQTKHKNYKQYYNKKTKEIVESLYKDDILNFGYSFDKKIYLF